VALAPTRPLLEALPHRLWRFTNRIVLLHVSALPAPLFLHTAIAAFNREHEQQTIWLTAECPSRKCNKRGSKDAIQAFHAF
jgi:hypothetical protein